MPARRRERAAAYNENLKQSRLKRFKEFRELRKHRFNQNVSNYRYILNSVQEYFEITQNALQNFIIDDEKQIEVLERFISNSSIRAIRFIQDIGKPPSLESGRFKENETETQVVVLTIDENILRSGKCIFFVKDDINVRLNGANSDDELHIGTFEAGVDTEITVSSSKVLYDGEKTDAVEEFAREKDEFLSYMQGEGDLDMFSSKGINKS